MGISFYIKGGMAGATIELMMLLIHIIAMVSTERLEKSLKLFAPPLAFGVAYLLSSDTFGLFMPTAILFFALGAYQRDMRFNKLFFSIGLLFLGGYSISIGANTVAISNLLGIIINVVVFYRLAEQRKASLVHRDN